ncbi:TlpA family protein disulfide reductase [Puia sp. P3]|uniref:TlpA family protein disulfide reductase n=1 Tax=Puia sp. P3 TaxID=3423952 RepID=UPI003D673DEF
MTRLDTLFHGLAPGIQNCWNGQKVRETLEAQMKTSVGRTAPAFDQPDADGHSISLSSFKGKYVLIDFWASWCGPCRAENPAVLKAYKNYHDKGLFILAVSLDDKKEDWLAAVKRRTAVDAGLRSSWLEEQRRRRLWHQGYSDELSP